MPSKGQPKSKARLQLWRQQVLAQHRKERARSQYSPEVAKPEVVVLEEGASVGVTGAAVVVAVVVKVKAKKARKRFPKVLAHSTKGTEKRHIIAWMCHLAP